MSDFIPQTRSRTDAASAIDQGLRTYMLGVYNLMALALVLTAVAAWVTFKVSFVITPGELVMTSIGQTLFGSPLRWVILLAPLAMVFFLSFKIHTMSESTAKTTFYVYAALVGVSLGAIFAIYTATSITRVFLITAATFGCLSLYGYTTKRDLSAFGSFLFMGLIGLIIAMVVNMFLASSALQFIISAAGVLIFAGLTAYDTQAIKELYRKGDSAQAAGRKSVMGALRLYLDFLNLFIFLLQFLGQRR